MAVIKIFDCNGVKTLLMLGNANEQDYDVPEEDFIVEDDEQDDTVGF